MWLSKMLLSNIVSCLLAVLPIASSLQVGFSQQYPLGSEIENLVIRPSGSVLTTVYTYPYLYEVEPVDGAAPRLLYTFSDTHGAAGIATSATPDVFYIVTGNFSFETFAPVPDSYTIHRLSFSDCNEPIVNTLAPLNITQPNGILHVSWTPYVLIADTVGGFIYKFDTATLQTSIYFDHPMLKPQPVDGVAFGVNGIKLFQGYLYFSNTNQQFIARIKATGKEDVLEGNPEIVASQTPTDDFILDEGNGDIYMAQQAPVNGLGYLSHEKYGAIPETIIGGENSTTILGPTAVAWAKQPDDHGHGRAPRNGRTLLLTASGDFSQFYTGNYTGGGKLAIINLDR